MRSIAFAFHQPGQADVLRPYLDKYLAHRRPHLGGARRPPRLDGPRPACSRRCSRRQETLDVVDRWLATTTANPAARRLVSEGRDDVARALAAQSRDADLSPTPRERQLLDGKRSDSASTARLGSHRQRRALGPECQGVSVWRLVTGVARRASWATPERRPRSRSPVANADCIVIAASAACRLLRVCRTSAPVTISRLRADRVDEDQDAVARARKLCVRAALRVRRLSPFAARDAHGELAARDAIGLTDRLVDLVTLIGREDLTSGHWRLRCRRRSDRSLGRSAGELSLRRL